MSNFLKRCTSKAVCVISLVALLAMTIGSAIPSFAAIETGDYFTLAITDANADGDSIPTTINEGNEATFVIQSLDSGDSANTLASADYALIEIMNTNWEPSNADITGLGAGLSIKEVTTPWGVATPANVNGNTDNLVAVNIGTGNAANNTFTVGSQESYNIFVWSVGAAINDGTATLSGQDYQNMTVTPAVSGAHHLVVPPEYSALTPEVGESFDIVVRQTNAGQGLVTSALTDVTIAASGVDVNITAINFESITPTPTATNVSLVNGQVTVSMTATGAGTLAIAPSSATLSSDASDLDASITVSAAQPFGIQGYGPINGQVGVTTSAPIEFLFNKEPMTRGLTPISLPETNASGSVFSIVDSLGAAVPGQWNFSTDTFGIFTQYVVGFKPLAPLTPATTYTASVLKTFVNSTNLGPMTALTDTGTSYAMTFTTGSGGGTYTDGVFGEDGDGFSGDFGGEFPPISFLSYPMEGEQNVPTNIGCITVGFDRPMNTSTFTTSNVYIKKMVDGSESATLPSGTPSVAPVSDVGDSLCISNYTFEADSDYRVIITRDVRSVDEDAIAGMPLDGNGDPQNGFGFGFDNMGSFKATFSTGSGSQTITSSMMGTNFGNPFGTITGVPVGESLRVSFDGPINPLTVTPSNVTLKKNGSVPVAGTVEYDANSNSVTFSPATVMSASTNYTLALSASVTSISGTAITPISLTFTTGAADTTKPTLVFADADNFGLSMQFDETLNGTTAENKSYYTVKTCIGQGVNADGVKCVDNSTDPTTVSLLSGVNVHYEKFNNSVWMDGLTLSADSGFHVTVSTGVTDVAGNVMDATANTWNGFVMNAGNFEGGQGMFQMDSMGFEDFDMKSMAMNPVGAWPMNSMAGATTKYFLNIPVSTQIPADGYIELTFPAGYSVTGVQADQFSPMNADFNGPGTGTVTFATTTSSVSTDTASSGSDPLDNGIGHIAGARKVYVQLDTATNAGGTDFLNIDLDGITNPTEARDFDTSGYQVTVKTYNSSGAMLEAMTTMPVFISAGGTNKVSGRVTGAPVNSNGIRVMLDSPSAGFQETTTANNANAGGQDGEYKFENLPDGDYTIFIEPLSTPSGGYTGKNIPLGQVTSNTTQNIVLTTVNVSNCATIPVSINFSDIGNITSLGFDDSIDVFGWNTTGQGGFVTTFTRAQVVSSAASSVNVFACGAGNYSIGIGPGLPKGDFNMFPEMSWMPPANQNVNVTTANIGGAALATKTFTVSAPDATIAGVVKDSSGTVVTSGKVFADISSGGFGGDSAIGSDGTFSIPVRSGKTYRVGAHAPGIPSATEHFVKINSGGDVYVDGSQTVSTGSTGATPFTITMSFNAATSLTVSGRVSDGTNAIAGAGVWAYRTDAPSPPVDGFTDSAGNYILYISSAGTWAVEAHAPGHGFLGTKTLTVTTEDFTSQDFEPLAAALLGTVSGTIDVPGTSDDSGAVVWAHNPDGFFNESVTAEDGTYSFDVPIDADAYTVEVWHPSVGQLAKTDQVVDGNETVSPAALGAPQTFEVTLSEAVSDDTFLDLKSTTGMGTGIMIPAGETTATATLPAGSYYSNLVLPIDNSAVIISGAEFNNVDGTPSLDGKVNFDGTGDGITITLPTLHTVTGTVDDGSINVEGVLVTVIDETTGDAFEVETDSSGDYTFEVPTGNYSVLTEQSGYVATPQTLVVAADLPSQDFSLDAADKTISGTITDSGGDPVEGALVYADMAGGGMATSETAADGTYTMYVSDGNWSVSAVTSGYAASTAIDADASSGNVASADISLPATTVTLQNPSSTSLDASSITTHNDQSMGLGFVLPADSIDADATLTFNETNELPVTSNATPFSKGIDVDCITTNDSSAVTSFDNPAELSFEYTVADLTDENVLTPTAAERIQIAYVNGVTNNWTTESTNLTYLDSAGAVIPLPTVMVKATLAAAASDLDLTTVVYSADINHLTTFAPIITSGATPPATPSGLAATAGDSAVTLSWTANGEADMDLYNIWEANVTEGLLTTYAHSGCTTTCSTTISSLTNGTAYSFQISAVDTSSDRSAYATAVDVTPAAAAAAVVAPSGGGGIILPSGGGSSSKKSSDDDEDEDEDDDETATEGTEDDSVDSTDDSDDSSTEDDEGMAAANEAVSDIAETEDVEHWARSYIENLFTKQIITSVLKNTYLYSPDDYMSRAGFVEVLVSTYGYDVPDNADDLPFSDVSPNSTYAPSIKAAYEMGVIEGASSTTFDPTGNITRAEALKFFIVASGIDVTGVTFEAGFPDVEEGAWYAPYVSYASQEGIVSGYVDGTFGPEKYLTRGQIAKISTLFEEKGLIGALMGLFMM
jgi:hypothetical protein